MHGRDLPFLMIPIHVWLSLCSKYWKLWCCLLLEGQPVWHFYSLFEFFSFHTSERLSVMAYRDVTCFVHFLCSWCGEGHGETGRNTDSQDNGGGEHALSVCHKIVADEAHEAPALVDRVDTVWLFSFPLVYAVCSNPSSSSSSFNVTISYWLLVGWLVVRSCSRSPLRVISHQTIIIIYK
jgi:hypothetical protein